MKALSWIALVLMGCLQTEEAGPCSGVCSVLFDECQMESLSSFDECEGSCAHAEEQGADIASYESCLADVDECNTFEIVECENEYGW